MTRMKWLFVAVFLLLVPFFLSGADDEEWADEEYDQETKIVAADEYDVQIYLKVPQVLENTHSMGYRKMKHQQLKGTMYINWTDKDDYIVTFEGMYNKNFKVGGKPVVYKCMEYGDVGTVFSWIGNNATGQFKTPCISMSILAEPSYAIGEPSADNSFILHMSGVGISKMVGGCRIARMFTGSVAGQQGCGCAAYTHKSPTRNAGIRGPTCEVVDIAPLARGKWRAKFKRRTYYNCN